MKHIFTPNHIGRHITQLARPMTRLFHSHIIIECEANSKKLINNHRKGKIYEYVFSRMRVYF